MTERNPTSNRVESTFNRAADSYLEGPAAEWEAAARGTLELAQLQPGEMVLDVCCGARTTALPAAEAVAPGGRVTGVDLSDGMLALARDEQERRGLTNVEFAVADMTELSYPSRSFDGVICQLGIFFVDDPQEQVARLWRLVKPGGRLVLTTLFGERNFQEPLNRTWFSAIEAENPELVPSRTPDSPLGRTGDVESMRQLMLDAGTSQPTITTETYVFPVKSPEDHWRHMSGTATRGTIERLGPAAAGRARDRLLGWMREESISSRGWSLIYSVAHK